VQLLPTLVGLVHRVEEGHRVADVDHHREAELARRLPDGVEAGIVHLDELVVVVADGQAQGLPDLGNRGTPFLLHRQPSRGPLGKGVTLLGPPVPVDAPEHAEEAHRVGHAGLCRPEGLAA
jgi:hypothetical protein